MGTTTSSQSSNVLASGMRRALNAKDVKLYHLVDFHGGGELMQWLKYAIKTGDYSLLDGVTEVKVAANLYNNGKGKLVPIAELVKLRNKERNAMVGALRKKKGKGKSGPNILEAVNQETMQGDMMKALKFLDGAGKGGQGVKYRELCWDMNQRGVMGETVVHLCLLNGTSLHNHLAKHLIEKYPKLVNDIFLSEEYYGQSPLHQAIVNEDINMVRFLLQNGADVNQRCVGAFFCPDDQKDTRADSMEHEWVLVNQKTTYTGRTYWGEYPLVFAACLNQEECFRLLRAKKADPNNRDTNGNTVLHLMVIRENTDMFDLAHKSGAKLHVANNQNLVPLTLAAKLAKKKMFDHILRVERDVLWTYGGARCAAYPLQYIDTIEEKTGEINKMSALALIVYGETEEHLELLEGIIDNLIKEKWNAYGKQRVAVNFFRFVVYFICFSAAFYFRQFKPERFYGLNITESSVTQLSTTQTTVIPWYTNASATKYMLSQQQQPQQQQTSKSLGGWFYNEAKCFMVYDALEENYWVRIAFECLTLFGILTYLATDALDIKRLGFKPFMKMQALFPEKMIFYFSFLCIITVIPFRLACVYEIEHVLAVIGMLTTSTYFFFFCRAFPFVGPFVLMVFKIITGDLLRFFVIYGIFVIGFSQAFYIIFLHGQDETTRVMLATNTTTTFKVDAFEMINRLFIMSVGEFQLFYQELGKCRLAYLGKVMFILFELLVSIMLINMLIAMMASTYQKIAETRREWKRQLAKVILMLEQALKPQHRLAALLKYSRPMGTDKSRRAFVIRHYIPEDEREDEKTEREEKWRRFRDEKRNLMKLRMQGGPMRDILRRQEAIRRKVTVYPTK